MERLVQVKRHVLVLGSGFVAGPLVRYLLDHPHIMVTNADKIVSKAEALIDRHPRGSAGQLNVEDLEGLKKMVSRADIVVSLLPWTYHLTVARTCLELKKHLVTASYVKPEMKALHDEAKGKGLLFLNEMGVDPGIDHMAAMRVIDQVKKRGGKITGFRSYCGGLPAFESNTNPMGYKFSWNPVGMMLASLSDGRYMREGKIIVVSGEKLFEHYWLVDIPGAGTFETYVNRDALPYRDAYGIQTAKDIYRGTLRNIGFCESWNYFKKIGLLDQKQTFDFQLTSPRRVIATLISSPGIHIKKELASFLSIPEYSITLQKMEWLGLFQDEYLPLKKGSAFDMFAYILQNRLRYEEGETDMLLQHHEFVAEYPDAKKERVTSTLLVKGIPRGDSAMSRTVGLPTAMAVKLIAEGRLKITGVHIPVLPEIYQPILSELETYHIKLQEQRFPLEK